PDRTRDHGPPRVDALAQGTTRDSEVELWRAPAQDGWGHRRLGRGLASIGRAHSKRVGGHRVTGGAGWQLPAPDDGGGSDRSSRAPSWRRSATASSKAATSAPGWGLSPGKNRRAIARSWARSRNAATST